MKKLLGIIVLGLLLSWNAYAEEIILECFGISLHEQGKTEDLSDHSHKIIIDFENKTSKRVNEEDEENIIVSNSVIYQYFIIWIPKLNGKYMLPGERHEYLFSVHSIDLATGKSEQTSNSGSSFDFDRIAIKLDKINSQIKDYQRNTKDPILLKYIKYDISKLGSLEQEVKKYNIVKDFINTSLDKKYKSITKYKCRKR